MENQGFAKKFSLGSLIQKQEQLEKKVEGCFTNMHEVAKEAKDPFKKYLIHKCKRQQRKKNNQPSPDSSEFGRESQDDIGGQVLNVFDNIHMEASVIKESKNKIDREMLLSPRKLFQSK